MAKAWACGGVSGRVEQSIFSLTSSPWLKPGACGGASGHRVWEITEWPRVNVTADWLHPLLSAQIAADILPMAEARGFLFHVTAVVAELRQQL